MKDRLEQGRLGTVYILESAEEMFALREYCVNQLCTVMHSPANQRIGRPGNWLINKQLGLMIAYF